MCGTGPPATLDKTGILAVGKLFRYYVRRYAAALRRSAQEAQPLVYGHRELFAIAPRTVPSAAPLASHRPLAVPRHGRPLSIDTWRPGHSPADDHRSQFGSAARAPITYFHDGNDAIVTASNYGGPKHPQWYFNLKAHPECELGDEKFLATEITDADDHNYLYGLATKVYAGWGDYRLTTDPIGRRIPVFRLKPR